MGLCSPNSQDISALCFSDDDDDDYYGGGGCGGCCCFVLFYFNPFNPPENG